MATKNVKPDEVASAITEMLTTYTEEATDIAKEVVDEMSQQVLDETKSHITWQDKKYSKSFALKTSFENKRNKRNTWYVKSPHYRLTHLLEFGHVTRNGTTRTRAFPHVQYGQQILDERFEKLLKERLENAKFENNTW